MHWTMAKGSLYKPLSTPFSFRLLELLPDKPKKPIRCRLAERHLTDHPEFTALSYEWDLVPGEGKVYVNDHALKVRKNLVEFLRVLREDVVQPVTIWADAICIDQSNIKERGHQVQLMRRIFRGATDVKSWLGPLAAELASAVDFCNLRPWTKEGWHRNSVELGWKEALTSAHSQSRIPGHDACSSPERLRSLADQVFYRITELCRASYWTRLWIMPEIILGRTVLLIWRQRRISLADFCDVMHWLSGQIEPETELAAWERSFFHDRSGENGLIVDAFDFYNIREWKESIRSGVDIGFFPLFAALRNRKCQHSRDRIYALLGVCDYQDEELPIQVDYQVDATHVFCDVIQYCIRSGQFDFDLYAMLLRCLELSPQRCLDRIRTAHQRQEMGVSPHLPSCLPHHSEGFIHPDLKFDVIRHETARATPFLYKLPSGQVLATGHALDVWDIWATMDYVAGGWSVVAVVSTPLISRRTSGFVGSD